MTADTTQWARRDDRTEKEVWERHIEQHNIYGYCSRYENNGLWNWQAVRGANRLSDICPTMDGAMACADAVLALPVTEFNTRVAAVLRQELQELERKLIALAPDLVLLPGYHAGYETGFNDARQKVLNAIAIDRVEDPAQKLAA